jgi:hypothetical protein
MPGSVLTDTLLPSQLLGLGSFPLTNLISMMNSRNAINYSDWSVLSFNVRGINAVAKGNGIHCVIRESNSDIICLQETKRECFVRADLRRFCPSYFDEFAFVPSIGNSGGFITVWNSSKLVLLLRRRNLGLSQTSMRPVPQLGKLIFFTGFLISTCPLISVG